MQRNGNTVLTMILGSFCLALEGCYTVRLNPIPEVIANSVPVPASLDISAETAAFTYDVRSGAAGVANRWRILVGEALVQYADAYLRPVFPQAKTFRLQYRSKASMCMTSRRT